MGKRRKRSFAPRTLLSWGGPKVKGLSRRQRIKGYISGSAASARTRVLKELGVKIDRSADGRTTVTMNTRRVMRSLKRLERHLVD